MANLIETIYIGCENNKSISLPTSSHIVRFCADTAHAHCTIMCLLSDVFFKAQLISDEDYAQGPYRVSIVFLLCGLNNLSIHLNVNLVMPKPHMML